MKKTTSKKLAKRLTKYGALTLAVAGITDASGQIVYTDVDPDFSSGLNGEYFLDLDNDGTNDFRITQDPSGGFSSSYNVIRIEPLTASNDVLASNSGNYVYPFALAQNANISSGLTDWNNNGFSTGYQSLNYDSCSFGNFCDTDAFIGLRFNIGAPGTATHYGWARVEVTNAGDNFIVKEFAYNTVADESILAGQQTLSTADNIINSIRVVALNKSIGLYNLPEQTNYRLFDVSGKQVLKGETRQNVHTIEAKTLANGIFILEIEDINTKAVLRKKLVI